MLIWQTQDRSDWKYPVAADEPDKAHWHAFGFDCLIVRSSFSGALCGYVGVPPSHPLYGKQPDEIHEVYGHGGLTFADSCPPADEANEARHICHMHEFAANPVVWWLGFDCGHLGDLMPRRDENEWACSIYRDFDYVQRVVENMAQDLKADGN